MQNINSASFQPTATFGATMNGATTFGCSNAPVAHPDVTRFRAQNDRFNDAWRFDSMPKCLGKIRVTVESLIKYF
ncbi:hypothetical protein GCG54_00012376 [Colletotrichum gloeosporioides]|uniref:Uncharacterized protein n=1 Tax=Colletotrichum gloeosporioides TaxID=474922 RepID=A0A8H4FHE1_COLGL|nr:uncharacterized protein GCG54_00012376 [Colletotrichum gloeosporioides]KAF3802130.1 hypothetical protein GCG54_00012376 [Colletotrichum gloeosporioides]